ncbi:MAG: hypothetical protein ACLF0G_00385 [Candidatus Brocadiia bacterium]
MPSRDSKLAALLRPANLIGLAVLGLLVYGGLAAYRTYTDVRRDSQLRGELVGAVERLSEQNTQLRGTVEKLEAWNERLRTFVQRLTEESRVADVVILGREVDEGGVPVVTLSFTELDRGGRPLEPRVVTVRGQEVYFDALVVKFLDQEVQEADPLRGKSLHLFRRVFGSAQAPRHGVLLDTAQEDGVPDFYRLSPQAADFERQLWSLFWHWVDEPQAAEENGVRVAQIEAVGVRPAEVGATYRITLEHDGGLSIRRVAPQP